MTVLGWMTEESSVVERSPKKVSPPVCLLEGLSLPGPVLVSCPLVFFGEWR